MKKILGILVLGLLWCNNAYTLDNKLEEIFPKGISKKQFCKLANKSSYSDVFKDTLLFGTDMWCHGSKQKHYVYFPKYKTEIIRSIRNNGVHFIFENVNQRMKCTSAFCKKGDGVLKKIAYSKNEANRIANPELQKKYEEKQRIAEEKRKKAEEQRLAEQKKQQEKQRIAEEKKKKEEEKRKAKLNEGCVWAVVNGETDESRKIFDWVCDKSKVAEIKEKKRKEEEKRKAEQERKKKEEEKKIAEKPKEQKKKKPKIETSSEIDTSLITIGSGSGFYINNQGYALTNNHVISICKQTIAIIEGKEILFRVLATDITNDVAVLKTNYKSRNFVKISEEGAKLGENIMAVGYPLTGKLSDSVKITKGIVSSLSGINNNIGQIQIDAALQPGNSGGPVLNEDGELVGIASAGLDKLLMAKEDSYIPENVNFAVASPIVVNILKSQKVKYTKPSFFSGSYSSTELAEYGNKSTVQLFCRNTLVAYKKLKSDNKYSTVLLDLE